MTPLQLLLNAIDYHRPELKASLSDGLEAAIKRASQPEGRADEAGALAATEWNADYWHLFLCQHCDNRATSPNGLNTVALKIADTMDLLRSRDPAPVACGEGTREAIARIIHGDAEDFEDLKQASMSHGPRQKYRDQIAELYAKADAILALSTPSDGMREAWQPIETAPKDGTRIWLADSVNLVTGFWSPPYGAWRCDWQVGSAGDKPTHWQPLPTPPVSRPSENSEAK